MILRIDHIGLVARSLEEASDLLLDKLGFTIDTYRTPMPNGIYMARENADIYFIQVGEGDTQLELLLPRDKKTGMGRWLEQIDLGPNAGAAFFYPRSTMGILVELVDAGTVGRLHEDAESGGRADT